MEGQTSYLPETLTQASALHFEPGIHQSESGQVTVYSDFRQGNLNAYAWNTEVGERIASYAYNAPALLLTIDGLEPVLPSQKPLDTPLTEAGIIWTHLPARPNKLNHTGQAYVVRGDTLFWQIPQAVIPDLKDPARFYPQMDAKVQTDAQNAERTYDTAIAGETAGIASLGLVLWGASKLLAPSATSQQLSRRRFLGNTLKLALATAVTGSLLRYPLSNITAGAANEPTKEFLQTIDNIIRPRLTRSTFVDGRTALLLAKAEDAQDQLRGEVEPTNVLVMGSIHADMAPTYVQEKGERKKAIAAYAGELLDTAKLVYASFFHLSPENIPPQVTQSLLNYVSQVDIVQVTDPGGSSFQPSIAQNIDKQVSLYKSFHSPQVEAAIAHLLPKQTERVLAV